MSDDCSNLWDSALDTDDPLQPKGYAGDTSAAYGLLAYDGYDPDVKLVLEGTCPQARFISLQAYRSRIQLGVGCLSDLAPGPFEIELTPGTKSLPVSIEVPPAIVISVFYRVYLPKVPMTENDLPRVYAKDVATGHPVRCPRKVHLPEYFDVPEIVADVVVRERNQVTFKVKELDTGTNCGIPKYCYSASHIRRGDVVIIRFCQPVVSLNAPNAPDVRYWSICSMDWPRNETLNGLPDCAVKPEDRIVTVVCGPKGRVEQKAHDLGFHFLPDTRRPRQHVLGFVYRNLLPEKGFEEKKMYQRGYLPKATVCSDDDFVNDRYHLPDVDCS